jgi:hypothetical protein
MRSLWSVIPLSLFLCTLLPQAAPAKTLSFDMGTEKSELRGGFVRITSKSLYSKDQGYGWKSSEGLREHYQPYTREWQLNESRGTTQPPPIYANELTCDGLWSKRANSFLVDLPDGQYAVYLLCGQSSGSPREYHVFDVAAGPARATIKIPGPYIFERRTLRVAVSGGQLAIDFAPQTDWLLAGLLVYPVSEQPKVRSEVLDALEKEIDFLPPDVAAKWQETKHVDPRPMPEFSQADRQRGYAVFARHYSEVIYPNTVPRPSELTPSLSIFASLGEYEPVTFTVHPLRDLHGAKVIAGELRSGEGVIPAGNLDVRYVRYMLARPNYSTFFSYHVVPDVLEHRESVDLAQGCNQRFWVTVKVPADAKPGVYEGKLTFAPSDSQPSEVKLRLRVLPIQLRKNPEYLYGAYYHDPLSRFNEHLPALANEYFQRKGELERQDMVEHGMNCHISAATGLKRDDQGRWTMDGTETERRIALDRKYGLASRPLVVSFPVDWWYSQLVDKQGTGSHLRLVRSDVPPSFFDEVTRMVEAIEAEKKKYDWPEFLYYPIDEPSAQANAVQFMANVLKAIKKVPGVRTYITADPSEEQFEPLWPYVDVWCCQPFVFDCEKIKRLSREKKIEFWCYPNHISGENDHTPVKGARMTWGFGFWRSGFKTLIPWIYQSDVGNPWNYLDGPCMDFFNRSTPEGEPIPVAMWEAYREGIDDGRYLYTLEQLVEEARKKGSPAAAVADDGQKELKYVWNSIRVQEKYKHDDLWQGAEFDAYRWLLASKILELQQAMAKP